LRLEPRRDFVKAWIDDHRRAIRPKPAPGSNRSGMRLGEKIARLLKKLKHDRARTRFPLSLIML
jgi:hypothetical protein